jgi:hypothetical protein
MGTKSRIRHLPVGRRTTIREGSEQAELSADAAVTAGENVVYVGYYQLMFLSGSYIKLELATSLNR